jgi:hypothetical protein
MEDYSSSSKNGDASVANTSTSLVESSEGGAGAPEPSAGAGGASSDKKDYHEGRRGGLGSFVKKVMGRRSSFTGSTSSTTTDHHGCNGKKHGHGDNDESATSSNNCDKDNISNNVQKNKKEMKKEKKEMKKEKKEKKRPEMSERSSSWKQQKESTATPGKLSRRAKSHTSSRQSSLEDHTPVIYYERTSSRMLLVEDENENNNKHKNQETNTKRDPLSLSTSKQFKSDDVEDEEDDDARLFDNTKSAAVTAATPISTTTTTTIVRVPASSSQQQSQAQRPSLVGIGRGMSIKPATDMAHNLLMAGPAGAIHKASKMVTKTGKLASSAVVASGTAVMGGGKLIVEGTGKAVVGGGKAIVEGTTNTLVYGGQAVVGGGKALVEGTTSTLVYGGQAVVGGGKAIVEGTTNTLVYGGQAVVGGGKAIVEGTTNTLVYGSRQVVSGTGRAFSGAVKGLRKPFRFQKNKMTQWDEGVAVIDELLDPETDAYGVLTEEQRKTLANVKKILLKGPAGGNKNKIHHIPRELIELQSTRGDMDDDLTLGIDTLDYGSLQDLNTRGRSNGVPTEIKQSNLRASQHSIAMRRNSNFILQEYGGVKNGATLLDDWSESSAVSFDDDPLLHGSAKEDTLVGDPTAPAPEILQPQSNPVVATAVEKESRLFCPPEFKNLAMEDKLELKRMLSWGSINEWGFDIFRLHEITKGHPLLFMGWAILGAPYSQQAMASEVGLYDQMDASEGYKFIDLLNIPPDKLCNYVRTIESDYNSENPYHNAIHAADVLQSLHSLIQMAQEEEFMQGSSHINLFSILLASIVHDTAHPGTTNAFHVQLKSELAVMYNDRSVLENWHAAHAFARMLDLDLRQDPMIDGNVTKSFHDDMNAKNNVLCKATPEQFRTIRKQVIDAVLHTDMTSHFESVNAAKGMLLEAAEDEDGMESEDRTWRLLMYMLHLADISGQAKEAPLFLKWTDRCMNEFFKQGDEELRLGLPISPNCDRNTTIPSVSQMGFIQFVIEPAFQVLGNYIPFVQEQVVPIIQKNLEYWANQQKNTQTEPAKQGKLETLSESREDGLSVCERRENAEGSEGE